MSRHDDLEIDLAKLNRAFDESGRTRKWLAGRCATTVAYLGQILRGDQQPGQKLIRLIEIALEVPEGGFLKPRRGSRAAS